MICKQIITAIAAAADPVLASHAKMCDEKVSHLFKQVCIAHTHAHNETLTQIENVEKQNMRIECEKKEVEEKSKRNAIP